MNTLAAPLLQGTTAITGGGLAIGVFLVVRELYLWFRTGGGGGAAPGGKGKGGPPGGGGGRNPKALIPFGAGLAFGTLMVACPAGLLGKLAGLLRGIGNGIGDGVTRAATGHSTATVANGSAPGLDGNGAIVVVVAMLLVIVAWKRLAKTLKGKFGSGVWCGTLLGISSGLFAFLGQLVVPTANDLGAQLLGTVASGAWT
ncbi:hypothetical protein PV350_04825 [Streptomyces sp. PA03-6a]|nr:hypothetical protein [Streptomyces sp. PA03-6a]